MASTMEPLRRDPFSNDQGSYTPKISKHVPMLGTVSGVEEGDPMDMSQSSGVPVNPPTSSPEGDHAGDMLHSGSGELQVPNTNGTSMPAGAAATQPKIVQTAFIHKLYKYVKCTETMRNFVTDMTTACSKIKASNI
jgi:hypothetical protein